MANARQAWAPLLAALVLAAVDGRNLAAQQVISAQHVPHSRPEYFATDVEYLPADGSHLVPTGPFPPVRFVSYPKAPASKWYFLVDAVALKRDATDRTFAVRTTREWTELYEQALPLPAPATFVGYSFTDTSAAVLGTSDLNFGFGGGGRALVGARLGDWYAVEASYMAVNSWNEAAAVRDNTVFVEQLFDAFGAPLLNGFGNPQPGTSYVGSLFSPFSNFGDPAVLGLDYNNAVSISYFSEMYDIQWNLRRTLVMPPEGLQVSLLVGGRYMNIQERFGYHSSSAYPANPTTNDVTTSTGNDMLGAQIGAFFEFHVEPNWWVDTEIKGVVFDNRVSQRTNYIHKSGADPALTFPTSNRSDNRTTWALDLALTLSGQVNSWLTFRIGYQAIWIDGLALASENFQDDVFILAGGPPQLNTDGKTVYHGPHIGITGVW